MTIGKNTLLKSLVVLSALIGTLSATQLASATSINPADIPNQTYIIGTHMFTREANQYYPGYITTASIMLAAQSIPGDNVDDMKVYYKTARGAWVDGLTNSSVEIPDSFEIERTNLEVSCNPEAQTISEAVCMQDINENVKSSMENGSTYTLLDVRDGKSYTIRNRYGDVRMTQNLALGGNSPLTLTSEDTDVSSDFTLPQAVTTKKIPRSFCTYSGACEEKMKIYASGNKEYGNYYQWTTAIADSPSHSICPKGWTLPTAEGETDGIHSYVNVPNYISDWSISLAGYIRLNQETNGVVIETSGIGESATFWYGNSAYALGLNTTNNFSSITAISKNNWVSIRCIAR